jgi:hypothetical protein
MTFNPDKTDNGSPFHSGESQIQKRVGKYEAMESFGRRVIRSFMTEQHQNFFSQLHFLIVGSVDDNGWPWASILTGDPGFTSSPNSTSLNVEASTLMGDPLIESLKVDAPLGLLGIEIPTRRRNRLNVRISEKTQTGFNVKVDQSFGNCPQYIQTRKFNFNHQANINQHTIKNFQLTSLDKKAHIAITNADTFFVSSYIPTKDNPKIEGVDVSHRGGKPGFVKVDGDTLTIPDYAGNFHFNTIGNFLINPKAGLLFPDFTTGDLLMLTGTVEILWEDDPLVEAFKGAERAWRFTLDHGLWINNALPFKAQLDEYSPNSLITGDWEQTAATLAAEEKRNNWRPYRVSRIEDESNLIRSFYLEPADNDGLASFKAGQFLTIRLSLQENYIIRNYTLSSTPNDTFYRISVKREQSGQVSNYFHDSLQVGSIIEAKAPSGEFFIDAAETRPPILFAGGVGITPMVSMAQHVFTQGFRTRKIRPITIFHAAHTTKQRAFYKKFRDLEQQAGGAVRYYSFISKPEEHEKHGIDFNGIGHITVDSIRDALSLDDYDAYLCGPPSFTQAIYEQLISLGVADTRIFAEAFGPASLTRQNHKENIQHINEADTAIIKFSKSGFEQQWSKGDASLLETAEAHGLAPEFSCRKGTCGSCAVTLTSGDVAYRTQPTATHTASQILICCAVPAKGSDVLAIDL